LLLLFLSAVRGHRSERPILGERKKRFPIFVRVGFDCPLDARAGKLPVFARCDHAVSLRRNLPDRRKLVSKMRPDCPKWNTIEVGDLPSRLRT
jgi:hypothetical protein